MVKERNIYNILRDNLYKNKVILLFGPRQVGKTTLLRKIQSDITEPSIWLNADEADIRRSFDEADTSTQLLQLVGGGSKKLIFIDEAQQIHDIGLKLKLLVDNYPELQIIATGSSAFELRNRLNEPLTGRKRELHLYPFSFWELTNDKSLIEEVRLIGTRLIYGSYPEVVNNPGNEKEILVEIANSYLYKDILILDGLRKVSILEKLLQALAFQVGSEVKYHELAQIVVNIDPATVEKYIELLEKAFIIFKLPGLNRNFRNEIKKGKKYYFYDNGIRNVLINNFNAIELRQDAGVIWENYVISERLKLLSYKKVFANKYFWRTKDQAEIDYIEERDGVLNAYEIKWSVSKVRFPLSFQNTYPDSVCKIIDNINYTDFLTEFI